MIDTYRLYWSFRRASSSFIYIGSFSRHHSRCISRTEIGLWWGWKLGVRDGSACSVKFEVENSKSTRQLSSWSLDLSWCLTKEEMKGWLRLEARVEAGSFIVRSLRRFRNPLFRTNQGILSVFFRVRMKMRMNRLNWVLGCYPKWEDQLASDQGGDCM